MELAIPAGEFHKRSINGHSYTPSYLFSTRSEALGRANHIRNQGKYARVERTKSGYLVITSLP